MAIWQVLNTHAPTKEMPASGIHHYMLFTHKHTHTFMLSVCGGGLPGAHHNRLLSNFSGVPSTNTDPEVQDFYNRYYSLNG